MPFLLFLKRIPWQAWLLLGILIAFAFLRSYWIGVGVKRCEAKQEAAQAAAEKESAKQEKAAPEIAEAAQAEVQVQVVEKLRIIREQIPSNVACPDYGDGVQSIVRQAASSSD